MLFSNVHFPILVQNYNFPCAFATECLCNSIFTATFCSFLPKKQKNSHIKVPAFPPPPLDPPDHPAPPDPPDYPEYPAPPEPSGTSGTSPLHKKNPRAFSARGTQIISP